MSAGDTHGGAELDLLLFKNGKRFGFELKGNDAPRITKSIKIAQQDLNLKKVFIIYPGIKRSVSDESTKTTMKTSPKNILTLWSGLVRL
ncbi:MAG: hypothetical protein U9R43_10525 [Thermodesulfobacteriota bacterium]|nr:hypothetical protein [Thermodesulfobacteriota bacterium]